MTGATGYIGGVVAEGLKAAGHRVTGLARSQAAAGRLSQAGHSFVEGGLDAADVITNAARRADAVIHCAGAPGPDWARLDNLAVDAILTGLTGSGKPFLYTSGVWVYGDTRDRMLGEVAHLRPPALVAWRLAVEEKVLAAKDRQVKSMVFRPGMVFGRGGGIMAGWFASAREEKMITVVGTGENHWSAVHVEDLADLYRRALEEPVAGELFVACSGMPQRVRKLADAVRRFAGDDVAIRFAAVEEMRPRLGEVADCLAMDCKAGSTKAVRFFGWGPRRPNIIGVLESGNQ